MVSWAEMDPKKKQTAKTLIWILVILGLIGLYFVYRLVFR